MRKKKIDPAKQAKQARKDADRMQQMGEAMGGRAQAMREKKRQAAEQNARKPAGG